MAQVDFRVLFAPGIVAACLWCIHNMLMRTAGIIGKLYTMYTIRNTFALLDNAIFLLLYTIQHIVMSMTSQHK